TMYYDCFLKHYNSVDRPLAHSVWLGGGSGFVTKTEVYSLYGRKQGVGITADLFRVLGVPDTHKHNSDRGQHVSPHTCKMAYYEKKIYQMGLCRMKLSRNTK
ncbi:MAG: hypothetical protein LUE92_14710, partial [Clostridiales bacterium]|nr:hypothetical protein [Clostridiales bacterium]